MVSRVHSSPVPGAVGALDLDDAAALPAEPLEIRRFVLLALRADHVRVAVDAERSLQLTAAVSKLERRQVRAGEKPVEKGKTTRPSSRRMQISIASRRGSAGLVTRARLGSR
jgi:hypothetical protein